MGDWTGRTIGWALCGSHHTAERALPWMAEARRRGAAVVPILSETLASTTTAYGDPETWRRRVQEAANEPARLSIPEVEPFGPGRSLDALVIAPCTGNTLAKLAGAITDSAPLMAAKAQLRNGRPVVLAISTNDALGLNAVNLARLLVARHVYFVPFGQDDPVGKPTSLLAHFELCLPTLEEALQGRQLQPLLQPW